MPSRRRSMLTSAWAASLCGAPSRPRMAHLPVLHSAPHLSHAIE